MSWLRLLLRLYRRRLFSLLLLRTLSPLVLSCLMLLSFFISFADDIYGEVLSFLLFGLLKIKKLSTKKVS